MRAGAVQVLSLLSIATFAGCLDPGSPGSVSPDAPTVVSDQVVFVHNALGQLLNLTDVSESVTLATQVFSVGQPGAEPTLGVNKDGYIFFQAMEKTYRSKDHGRTWQRVGGLLTAQGTSDPYIWVDPTTDRVFQINQGAPFGGRGPVNPPALPPGSPVGVSNIALALFCAHIAWSDDDGVTWLANPIDCGPVPGVDHIKLATGPWTGNLAGLPHPAYPNAVYFAYNKAFSTGVSAPVSPPEPETGGYMTVSFDGGATFPLIAEMFPQTCNGGLHGDIAVGPDGALYVPARNCPAPLVAYSYDNGRTWKNVVVGQGVGVPEQQKNPTIGVDAENNVYLSWVGKDNRLYLSVSRDRAATWSEPVPMSPPAVGSAIWPAAVAGDEGRFAVAYIGTEESSQGAWNVTNSTRWHLYYTYTLDGLDANPTFVTIRATDDADPVQRGTICVQSSKCKDGNRNLLDFIDLALDGEGRAYVAYADGCTTPQCLRAHATPLDSRDREGMVMVLEAGPSLHAAQGDLTPFE